MNLLSRYFRSSGALIVFFLAITLLVFRRPDIISNAQFWAEDGRIWYPDAYSSGFWSSLLQPQNGYFQTISRLVFAFVVNIPLEYGPLVSNCIALVFRTLPLMFLFTSRFHWFDIRIRCLAALYVLLMPGIEEVHANTTNTHWYLALYLFLIVIADDPKSKLWKIHDTVMILLCGLSGPFALLIAPCYLPKIWHHIRAVDVTIRTALKHFVTLPNMAFGLVCIVQFAAILLTSDLARSTAPLGASFHAFLSLMYIHQWIGVLWVPQYVASSPDGLPSLWILVPGFLAASTLLVSCLIYGSWRLRAAILFLVLILAVSLARPMVNPYEDQWQVMLSGPSRYYLLPNIIWASVIISLIVSIIPSRGAKNLAMVCIAILIVASASQYFRIAPLPDRSFGRHVLEFEAAPRGTVHKIPINPDQWFLRITKKGGDQSTPEERQKYIMRALARKAGYQGFFENREFETAIQNDHDLKVRYMNQIEVWKIRAHHRFLARKAGYKGSFLEVDFQNALKKDFQLKARYDDLKQKWQTENQIDYHEIGRSAGYRGDYWEDDFITTLDAVPQLFDAYNQAVAEALKAARISTQSQN